MNHANPGLDSGSVAALRDIAGGRDTAKPAATSAPVAAAAPATGLSRGGQGDGRRSVAGPLSVHPTMWQFVVARDGRIIEACEPYLATSTVSFGQRGRRLSVGVPSLDEQLKLMLAAAFDGRLQQELIESARGSIFRLLVTMSLDNGLIRVELLDLNATLRFPTELFSTLFGLTATECMILNALLHGDTLREYAEKNSVSRNTARTHLKSVFMKTRTHRQADLVRMTQLLCISQIQDRNQLGQLANKG